MNVDDLQHLMPSQIGPIGPSPGRAGAKPPGPGGPSFDQVFQDRLGSAPLKLSAHAQQRLTSRQINFNSQDWDRIQAGVDRAAAKGAREALVLTDKAALVVSVKNRTVITAVDPANLKENVFTNIDSAVIV